MSLRIEEHDTSEFEDYTFSCPVCGGMIDRQDETYCGHVAFVLEPENGICRYMDGEFYDGLYDSIMNNTKMYGDALDILFEMYGSDDIDDEPLELSEMEFCEDDMTPEIVDIYLGSLKEGYIKYVISDTYSGMSTVYYFREQEM